MKVIKVNSHDMNIQTANFSNGSFISFKLIERNILQVLKTNIYELSSLASKEISFDYIGDKTEVLAGEYVFQLV
ncbi:hypothetical protein ACA358_03870 [Enterococcus faecium]|uniref:hypothetical protein n=1 Tax=Enterococcus faecium TaxID=1352 RepID=UPI0001B6D0D7|nr:hypothetical protein [Enterococcus faecium]EEV62063.1 predicted protein [Enterococcus faecium Com15]MDQ8306404.1 hypothetical protein [Enterococcus faecium]MDQ8311574.1 hypothetical protein [Enterococcus faecium]